MHRQPAVGVERHHRTVVHRHHAALADAGLVDVPGQAIARPGEQVTGGLGAQRDEAHADQQQHRRGDRQPPPAPRGAQPALGHARQCFPSQRLHFRRVRQRPHPVIGGLDAPPGRRVLRRARLPGLELLAQARLLRRIAQDFAPARRRLVGVVRRQVHRPGGWRGPRVHGYVSSASAVSLSGEITRPPWPNPARRPDGQAPWPCASRRPGRRCPA